MASGSPSVIYVIAKAQVVMMIILAYQIYLAVGTEMVDEALKGVERVSSWPIQALNIGLFVLVLGICWLYLQSPGRIWRNYRRPTTKSAKNMWPV